MSRLPLPRDTTPAVFWRRLRTLVTGRRTWSEIAFLLLRLPLEALGFVIATTLVGLMFQGLVEPILVAAGVETQQGSWADPSAP